MYSPLFPSAHPCAVFSKAYYFGKSNVRNNALFESLLKKRWTGYLTCP